MIEDYIDESAAVSRKYHEEKLDAAIEFGVQISLLAFAAGVFVGILLGYLL